MIRLTASASARTVRMNPSAMRAMCPSKTPIAMEGESWNRWLAQGKG